MARPPLLGKEGKAPRLSTSRFIHVFSPCSKNSLVPTFPLQSTSVITRVWLCLPLEPCRIALTNCISPHDKGEYIVNTRRRFLVSAPIGLAGVIGACKNAGRAASAEPNAIFPCSSASPQIAPLTAYPAD